MLANKLIFSAAAYFLSSVVIVNAALGTAGNLDPSFGSGGKVITHLANDLIPADAILQSDGKVVVAAGVNNTTVATEAFGLLRYFPNGSLDSGFGNGGIAETAFTNFINTPHSIALQRDGKIIVVGEASSANGELSEFAIARFNPDGSPDTGFGNGGQIVTNFVGVQLGGVSNVANAVLLYPDGRILVGGSASQCAKCGTDAALGRYNSDGSLDTTFGQSGTVRVRRLGGAIALALLSNDHILTLTSPNAEFAADGTRVSVAGGTVIAQSRGGNNSFLSDSRYYMSVPTVDIGGRRDIDVRLVRFQPTGAADSTFNSPRFDFGAEDHVLNFANAVVIQPDGKILAGGVSLQPSVANGDFGLARLNSDGSFDPAFGAGGKLTTAFPGLSTGVGSLIVQSDGKIVAIGGASEQGTIHEDLVLARYLAR